MRLFITVLLLSCFTLSSFSQDSLKLVAPVADTLVNSSSLNATMINIDSMDKERSMKQMNQNLQSFMLAQNEKSVKEKRAALLRIAFGVVMLVVLVIGWRRKRKQ
jgi:hypothetical protein